MQKQEQQHSAKHFFLSLKWFQFLHC